MLGCAYVQLYLMISNSFLNDCIFIGPPGMLECFQFYSLTITWSFQNSKIFVHLMGMKCHL